jgi:hypothetical protein
VLAAGIWANTGTLAPYAATLSNPMVRGPCQYLLSIDHDHFRAVFLMLDGAPRESWEFSVVLRRILHPLAAYPLMKLLGFEVGGILANVLLSVASLIVFWRAAQRRYGEGPAAGWGRALNPGLWLLATYTGFFYWAGLPYSYAAIVPLSLLSLTLLWRLETLTTAREAMLYGLALGVLFTGYDLLPFFGIAGILLLLYRRLLKPCAVFAVAQAAPTVLVAVGLQTVSGVGFWNSNTALYGNVAKSYLPPIDVPAWVGLLEQLPQVVFDIYFYSNFFFLPLLYLIALFLARRLPQRALRHTPAEACLLLAAALLFLFNNAAPPYDGWQLRGSWIARLYQPVGVAMISSLIGLCAKAQVLPLRARQVLGSAIALTLAAQVWIAFGPAFGVTGLSGFVYHRFYRHDSPAAYAATLEKFGSRPLGFCTPPSSLQAP